MYICMYILARITLVMNTYLLFLKGKIFSFFRGPGEGIFYSSRGFIDLYIAADKTSNPYGMYFP